jgi:hypothetical protein
LHNDSIKKGHLYLLKDSLMHNKATKLDKIMTWTHTKYHCWPPSLKYFYLSVIYIYIYIYIFEKYLKNYKAHVRNKTNSSKEK